MISTNSNFSTVTVNGMLFMILSSWIVEDLELPDLSSIYLIPPEKKLHIGKC